MDMGVKDFEKAASLFEEASDTNPRANYHLGQMARHGLGLKQDYKLHLNTS